MHIVWYKKHKSINYLLVHLVESNGKKISCRITIFSMKSEERDDKKSDGFHTFFQIEKLKQILSRVGIL